MQWMRRKVLYRMLPRLAILLRLPHSPSSTCHSAVFRRKVDVRRGLSSQSSVRDPRDRNGHSRAAPVCGDPDRDGGVPTRVYVLNHPEQECCHQVNVALAPSPCSNCRPLVRNAISDASIPTWMQRLCEKEWSSGRVMEQPTGLYNYLPKLKTRRTKRKSRRSKRTRRRIVRKK